MWDIGTESMQIICFYKNISSVCNNITFQYDFQIELHEFSFKIIFKSDMLGIWRNGFVKMTKIMNFNRNEKIYYTVLQAVVCTYVVFPKYDIWREMMIQMENTDFDLHTSGALYISDNTILWQYPALFLRFHDYQTITLWLSLLRTQRGACAALGPPSTTTRMSISLCHGYLKCARGVPGRKFVQVTSMPKNTFRSCLSCLFTCYGKLGGTVDVRILISFFVGDLHMDFLCGWTTVTGTSCRRL